MAGGRNAEALPYLEILWDQQPENGEVNLELARNYAAMTLEVRVSSRGAQALYRRFGFVPEGARKNYYVGPPEDAVVMWVRGIDTPEHRALLDALERQAAEGVHR